MADSDQNASQFVEPTTTEEHDEPLSSSFPEAGSEISAHDLPSPDISDVLNDELQTTNVSPTPSEQAVDDKRLNEEDSPVIDHSNFNSSSEMQTELIDHEPEQESTSELLEHQTSTNIAEVERLTEEPNDLIPSSNKGTEEEADYINEQFIPTADHPSAQAFSEDTGNESNDFSVVNAMEDDQAMKSEEPPPISESEYVLSEESVDDHHELAHDSNTTSEHRSEEQFLDRTAHEESAEDETDQTQYENSENIEALGEQNFEQEKDATINKIEETDSNRSPEGQFFNVDEAQEEKYEELTVFQPSKISDTEMDQHESSELGDEERILTPHLSDELQIHQSVSPNEVASEVKDNEDEDKAIEELDDVSENEEQLDEKNDVPEVLTNVGEEQRNGQFNSDDYDSQATEQTLLPNDICTATEEFGSTQLETIGEIDDLETPTEFSSSQHVTTEEQQEPVINEPIQTETRDQQVCFAQVLETEQEQHNIEPLEEVLVDQAEPSKCVVEDTTLAADVHRHTHNAVVEAEQQVAIENQSDQAKSEELHRCAASVNEPAPTEEPLTITMDEDQLYGPEDREFANIANEEHSEVTDISPHVYLAQESVPIENGIEYAQVLNVNYEKAPITDQNARNSGSPTYMAEENQAQSYLAQNFSANFDEKLSSDKENDQAEFEERYAKLMEKFLPRDHIFDNSSRKQRSKTLEPNFDINALHNWTEQPVSSRQKSATLGRSGSRKRTRPLPKPAVNDDHLFPDSVTPSKVDRNLSVRSLDNGLPEGTYDVPYIDDDAFVPKRNRDKSATDDKHGNESDLSTESDEYLWDPSLIRYSALDPSHRADIDECVDTPQIIKKTGSAMPGGKKGDRSLIKEKKTKRSRKRRFLNLCGCVGRRSHE